MRHLGPISLRILADTRESYDYGRQFESVGRTLVGQLLSYSGDLAINALTRRYPDGTLINVALERAGLIPTYMVTIKPPPFPLQRRPEGEDQYIRPYFFAGLQHVSGGEIEPNPRFLDNYYSQLGRVRGVRALPHLVVWEPANGDKTHDDPVMVKRWASPKRPPGFWTGQGIEETVPYPGDYYTPIWYDSFVNATVGEGLYYANPIQNAYWWYDGAIDYWRYSFYARNNNNLYVWEYDNRGLEPYTPHPRTGELYLGIASADPEPLEGVNYDDITFKSYPASVYRGTSGPFIDLSTGHDELRYVTARPLEQDGKPPIPYQPATLVPGNYLIKIVVEGSLDFTPLTVRLRVQTGWDLLAGKPVSDDTYDITIQDSTNARRVLFPGGFNAYPPLVYSDEFGTDTYVDGGTNPLGSAWSSETIIANSLGGSSSGDVLPWGFVPEDLPDVFGLYAPHAYDTYSYSYRNSFYMFFTDRVSLGLSP